MNGFKSRIAFAIANIYLHKYVKSKSYAYRHVCFKWLLVAASFGNSFACAVFGFMLEFEQENLEYNYAVAEKFFVHSIKLAPVFLALSRLAFLKYHKRDGILIDWSAAESFKKQCINISSKEKARTIDWANCWAALNYEPALFYLSSIALQGLYPGANKLQVDELAAYRFCDQAVCSSATPSAFSLNLMGTLYVNGIGVDANPRVAFKYYKRAADLHDAAAMYNLGTLYERGLGVEDDFGTACLWYQKAADFKSPNAENVIGIFHETAELGEPDISRALHYYFRAAAQGHPHALHNVGRIFHEGLGGINPDQQLAKLCFYHAGRQNHGPSALRYAIFCELGIGKSKNDGVTSEHTLKELANLEKPSAALKRSDSAISIQPFADKFHLNALKLDAEADTWMLKAASLNVPEAMNRVLFAEIETLIPVVYALYNTQSAADSLLTALPNEIKWNVCKSLFATWQLSDEQISCVIDKITESSRLRHFSRLSAPFILAFLGYRMSLPFVLCDCEKQNIDCKSVKHFISRWSNFTQT